MYAIPAELINNFICYLEEQFCKLVTEMHMTEFCEQDRAQLNKLVRHLDRTSQDVLFLALYKINSKDEKVVSACKEFDQFRNSIHELILEGKADHDLIETLQKANAMIDDFKKRGN